jgi:hypothetical protein
MQVVCQDLGILSMVLLDPPIYKAQIIEVENVILLVVPCTTNLVHVEQLIDHLHNVLEYVPMEVVSIGY